MRILFLGDMVGRPARRAVARFIEENKEHENIDVVIANSDNLAHGRGVTRKTVEEMLDNGVDVLTCGDHAWDNSQAFDILEAGELNFICPANMKDVDSGLSARTFDIEGIKILVINLMGQIFMDRETVPPFAVVDAILKENEEKGGTGIIFVDFHAEATSEKKAMGRYLSGRVSAVVGTHTHVQTADEEVFEGGTAYISDVGMVGVEKSILGCEIAAVLDQYMNNAPFKYKLAEDNNIMLEGVMIDVDEDTGKATKIERYRKQIILED